MQLQGNISAIEPTGGYQTPNGYIYTFNMAIETPQGSYMGQIGSKSEQYPANIGDAIIVEATQDKHGTKFKKVNPQFAKSQQPAPQKAMPVQQPQQRPLTAKPNGNGDETLKYRSMCLAYVKDLLVAGAITPKDINTWLDTCVKYILSGLWQMTQIQPPVAKKDDLPEWDGQPQEAEESIPF